MSAEAKKNAVPLRQSESGLEPDPKPIVLNYKKWKKQSSKKAETDTDKPRYTKGLADVQKMEGDAVQIAQTAARALSMSLDTYHEARQKSAKKKTDGALEDFIHNTAKATSTFLKETSDIPVEVADSISRSNMRKNLRKGIRRAAKKLSTWTI